MDAKPTANDVNNNPKPASTEGTSDAQGNPAEIHVGPEDAVVPGAEGDTPVTVVMKPPKKRKLGMIITIIVLFLFLISGGCLAYWYFCIYSNPANVAGDAMRQLITAKNVITDGSVQVTIPNENRDTNIILAVELKANTNQLPASTATTLSITEREDDGSIVDNHQISVELGSVVMANGVLYLQISNLEDTLDTVLNDFDTNLDPDFADFITDVVEIIDDEWWQISLADIAAEYDLDERFDAFQNFYQCELEAYQNRNMEQIATLYSENSFLTVEEVKRDAGEGNSAYSVDFDYNLMADFVNTLPTTDIAESFYACFNDLQEEFNLNVPNNAISAEDFNEIDATDLKKILSNETEIYLYINNGSHKLHGLEVIIPNKDQEITAKFNFDYAESIVEAPASYRSVTELIEEIVELFMAANEDIDDDLDFPYNGFELI